MAIDFENDSASAPLDSEIASISTLIKEMERRSRRINTLENELEAAKAEYKQLAQRDLPEAMKAARLSRFTTDDGLSIELKEEVYASISEKNREAAYAYLLSRGDGDLIKSVLELNFGKGESEQMQEFVEGLQELGMSNYKVKESIHANTLKAWVREMVASGEDFPHDLFGVFQFKEAVLKK
jgi:predicted RNase H-like nuclease (RuvC/YqgF family)